MIAAAGCDVWLANHYYLGLILQESRTSPWPPPGRTRTARARTRTSPASGVFASSKNVPTAVALMEWLTSPPAQQEIIAGSEFAANRAAPAVRAHREPGRT